MADLSEEGLMVDLMEGVKVVDMSSCSSCMANKNWLTIRNEEVLDCKSSRTYPETYLCKACSSCEKCRPTW